MPDRPPRDLRDHGTPPLFEGADDVADEAGDTEASAGLDRIVTRIAPRPKHWAMKWRPNEGESDRSSEIDRHPARTAGQIEPEASAQASDADPVDPTERSGSATPLVLAPNSIDALHTATPTADAPEAVEAPTPAVMTSRTWRAEDEAPRRHPATPSSVKASTSVAAAVHAATVPATRGRRLGVLGLAGWLVAGAMAIGWLLQEPRPAASDAEIIVEDTPAAGPVLARPAVDPFEADLAREEISSLRHERARLMQEVRAAEILLEDHRRLTTELRESTVTNTGAAVELGVLEDETRRWQRRHEVAMARMDELAQLLVDADRREAALEAELDALRQRLEALDASNGAD